MKLLFDQNISHRLVLALVDLYPGSQHVREVGMKAADDSVIWDYARRNGFMIVSKDSDFHQRSFLLGYPPKVIWVRLGNCSTIAIEKILRDYFENVEQFEADSAATFLVLSRSDA
jgi:predicted nuclease of predicted toxin-antitoxin system